MLDFLRKIFLCPLLLCACRPESDETGCWGECVTCGRRFGFVDRATLRARCDAEAAASDANRWSDLP